MAVVWVPAGGKSKAIQLSDAKLQLWDMMGRPQSVRTFTPGESPMYVIGEGVSAEEFEKLLGPADTPLQSKLRSLAADGTSALCARCWPMCRRPLNSPLPNNRNAG